MTMPMQNRGAFEFGRMVVDLAQVFVKQERLLRKTPGPIVARQQPQHLVAENGGAARLQEDDGGSGIDFGSQRLECLLQPSLCARQHTVVVKRAPAAEHGTGDSDLAPRGLQHLYRGASGVRQKVVVKS